MMLIGLVIIGIVLYVVFKPTHGATTTDDALEVLKRRYAQGVLTREEFLRMKDELS